MARHTPQNKRREVCLEGGVGGWPTASHPFYEWGGIIVSPLQAIINQTLTLPCVQGRESPALRPLHAPVHGSNTGAKNNLDHNSLLPHPTTSPGPSGCTPRYVDPPPGPGNVESIVPAPCPCRASARQKLRRGATYVRRERGGGVTHPRIFVNRASR